MFVSSVLDGGVVGGIVLVCKPLVFAHVQDHKETPEQTDCIDKNVLGFWTLQERALLCL